MLVYCDTNVYCRPLDDQSQARIQEETFAFLGMLEGVDRNRITLVSSDILAAEVRQIADGAKRRLVELYLARCTRHVPASRRVVEIAEELVRQCELKPKDAFHVGSACAGRVGLFLTCDDRLASKRRRIAQVTRRLGFEVKVMNPLELPTPGEVDQRE